MCDKTVPSIAQANLHSLLSLTGSVNTALKHVGWRQTQT